MRPPARPSSARSSSGRPPASASRLGLQPRPPASASLGQPRPIGRYLVWLAGYTGPAFLIGTLRLSYGRLVEPEETEDVAARLADGVLHLLAV